VFQLQQKYNQRISAKINDLEKYTTLYSRKSSVDFCQILGVGPESVILLYVHTREQQVSFVEIAV